MNRTAKNLGKRCVEGLRRIFKKAYWVGYGNVITYLISLKTPAVNDMRVDEAFRYQYDGYYPTLYKKSVRRFNRIYKRANTFDAEGLPTMTNSDSKYWPVTIAQFGLLNYNYYLTDKTEVYKKAVVNSCNWLVDNIDDEGRWLYWNSVFLDVVDETLKAPFVSAMAQGEGISLLIRGYKLTHDSRYLRCAEEALNPFFHETSVGGVCEKIGELSIFEEYPTVTPSHVLNGFLFSMFGLYDLSCTHGEKAAKAQALFNEGYDTLIKILPLFDAGFCSRYDLGHLTAAPRRNARPFYHFIHVNQLIAINSIRESKVLQFYIREWK